MSSLSNKAMNSQYNFTQRGDLEVLDAVICWKNFEGRENQFGSKKRTFNLVLTEDLGHVLEQNGWNIKFREPREEGDLPFVTTEIVVNMEHDDPKYDPEVKLYSSFNGRRSVNNMNADTIGELDHMEFERVDLMIHPYVHNRGQYSTKGYLNSMSAIQAADRSFGGFYSDWMNQE